MLRGLLVIVPNHGRIEPQCEVALVEIERVGATVWRAAGYTNLDIARSQLATDALALGFKEIMWIDADIAFDLKDVVNLRKLDLPWCCALYVKKGERAIACSFIDGTQEVTFGKNGTLLEVRHAGTGFMYTRSDVYDRIRKELNLPVCNLQFGKPIVPFFQSLVINEPSGPWLLAEDYAFCERGRMCGLKLIADTRIRLWHIGSYAYSWEDAGKVAPRYGSFVFALTNGKTL